MPTSFQYFFSYALSARDSSVQFKANQRSNNGLLVTDLTQKYADKTALFRLAYSSSVYLIKFLLLSQFITTTEAAEQQAIS